MICCIWRKIMVLVEAWSNHPVRLTWIKGLSSSTESLASTPSSFLLRVHLQNPPPPPFLSSSPWIKEYYAIQHHVKEHNSFYFEMAILKFQDLLLHSAKSLLSIAWPLRAHVHKVSVSSWSCVKWWSGVRFDFWACESRKLVIYQCLSRIKDVNIHSFKLKEQRLGYLRDKGQFRLLV